MRPQQQQNRRMRRGNSNRKAPNPLARSYESNGPDVKIRGSAQQIADKYLTLAQDAQSSGDRVIAENYLQHAEHYSRIVAAAQVQAQAQAAAQAPRENRDDNASDDRSNEASSEERGDNTESDDRPSKQPVAADGGSGPQPVIEGTPVEVAIEQEAASANEGDNRSRGRSRRPNRPAVNEANGVASSVAASDNPVATEASEESPPRRPRRTRTKIAVLPEETVPDAVAPKVAEDGGAEEGGIEPDTPTVATG